MNPLMFFNPARWVLYGALIAAVVLGLHTLDKSRQAIGYGKAQAEYTAAALKASEQARAKEQELMVKNEKVANDYQIEKKRRVADARVNAGRLQELTAALAASANPATSSGIDDTYRTIINQCSGALVGMDEYAQEMAGKARALQDYTRAMRVN